MTVPCWVFTDIANRPLCEVIADRAGLEVAAQLQHGLAQASGLSFITPQQIERKPLCSSRSNARQLAEFLD
jgi:hypothetical protein